MKWTRIGGHFAAAAAALNQTVKPLLILNIEIISLHSARKIHYEYILKIKKQCSQFRHTTIFNTEGALSIALPRDFLSNPIPNPLIAFCATQSQTAFLKNNFG